MIDRAGVDRWLDDYVAAWKTYDRDAIGALFAEDVEYRYHPYDEPIRGRDAVLESGSGRGVSGCVQPRRAGHLRRRVYRAVAVDGDVAVAVGAEHLPRRPGGPVTDVYDNCFLLRFDAEGRCRELTEWFVKRPRGADA